MAHFPFVSVVIPARNEERTISDCLQSLLKQDYPKERFEIIVVDNGSTDRTHEIVRQFPVRYLLQKEGDASTARNRGVRAARAKFLAFTDGDCRVPPDWISQLVEGLMKTDSDAVGGFCRISDGESILEHYLASRSLSFEKEFLTVAFSPFPCLVTANVMIRRSAFSLSGGFEEGLFPREDQDFFWRLSLSGGKIGYLPHLTVSNVRPMSLVDFWRRKFRAGKMEQVMELRYKSLIPSRDRRTTSLWAKTKEILLGKRPTHFSMRLLHFFFGSTGYLAFQGGKVFAKRRHGPLKGSPVVSPLPKKFCENQLLYLASHPAENGVDQRELRKLVSKVHDWDRFLAKANDHRLLPKLYFFLKRQGAPSFLNPEVWKKIDTIHLRAQFYVLAHEAELLRLLPHFNQSGIDLLLMKGGALGLTLYKNRPVRSAVDLDLLIHPEDFSRADRLLQELGYEPHFPQFPSRWHSRELGPQSAEAALIYRHPERSTCLDIHREVFELWTPVQLEPDWLWKNAKIALIGESKVYVPDKNWLFLHLLLHLIKDRELGRESFHSYLDLDACLRYGAEEIDSHFLRETLQETDLAQKALKIFSFLDASFHSPLPDEVQILLAKNHIRPHSPQQIFSPERPPRRGSELARFIHPKWADPRERFFSYWNRLTGFSKRTLFLWHWLFPDPDYLGTKYPLRNFWEKAVAYLKHLGVMMLKGLSLGVYLIRKSWYHSLR